MTLPVFQAATLQDMEPLAVVTSSPDIVPWGIVLLGVVAIAAVAAIALVIAAALFRPNVITADRGSKVEVSQRAKVEVPARD